MNIENVSLVIRISRKESEKSQSQNEDKMTEITKVWGNDNAASG